MQETTLTNLPSIGKVIKRLLKVDYLLAFYVLFQIFCSTYVGYNMQYSIIMS